jgi:hypothetical protein
VYGNDPKISQRDGRFMTHRAMGSSAGKASPIPNLRRFTCRSRRKDARNYLNAALTASVMRLAIRLCAMGFSHSG